MIFRLLVIGAGGALGAILRFLTSEAVSHSRWAQPSRVLGSSFPWGTLVVNLTGCLAIGVATGLCYRRLLLHPDLRAFLLVGLLGGYTTFSTFSLETLELLRDGDHLPALINGLGSPILGIFGVWLGLSLSKLL